MGKWGKVGEEMEFKNKKNVKEEVRGKNGEGGLLVDYNKAVVCCGW